MWARASSLVPWRSVFPKFSHPVYPKRQRRSARTLPPCLSKKRRDEDGAPSRVFTNLCSPLRMDTLSRKPGTSVDARAHIWLDGQQEQVQLWQLPENSSVSSITWTTSTPPSAASAP